MPLAETLWWNADPDADWETPLGQRDRFAWMTWHRVPRSFYPAITQPRRRVQPLGLDPRRRYSRAMCGRARLSSDVSEIKLVFSIPPDRPTPNVAPSWNVAPTDPLPVVRYDTRAGERSLDVMRWGLVPFWAKDIKVGFANIPPKPRGSRASPPSARSAAALPRASRQFLRVEEDRDGEAALGDRAG
jgi:SOS response associated peptidase (SRAP)